jgi:gamma-glutamylcyclotransferase (GGCT)/AIG2-like uncharacterized protein YtfP
MPARREHFLPGGSGGEHLFVYGSLVDPRQLTEVLGHAHEGEVLRARLRGFRRVKSPSYAYPFVVADAQACVDGVLVMDLGSADLVALDAYEEVEDGVYSRVPVEVEAWGCGPTTATLRAQTYTGGPRLLNRL